LGINPHRDGDATSTQTKPIPIAYQAPPHHDVIAPGVRSRAGTPVLPCRAVFDKKSPLAKKIREQLSDKKLRKRIYDYAFWRAGNAWDAKDLVAEALAWSCDPARKPWDSEKRSLFAHLRFAMDDIAIERARTGYGRFEEVGEKGDEVEFLEDPRPKTDEALEAHQGLARLRRIEHRLRAHIGDRDPLAVQILDAAHLGLESIDELANHLDRSDKEIFEALRRLKYHGAAAVNEEAEAEGRRMKEAREKAKKEKGR
jgi:DNA-directed RNA polymerase specialized sigma24 family protein